MAEGAHAGGLGIPELPNLLTLLARALGEGPAARFLHGWEDVLFAWGVIAVIALIAWAATRRVALVPHGLQNAVELLVEGLDQFVCGILGEQYGRRFTPFIGTLFLYIWLLNLSALIPGLKSPTANVNTTAGLAVAVFCYVQWMSVRLLGVKGYLHHMAGSPSTGAAWVAVPLIFFVEFLGQFIKPISLCLRLYGNVTGEDALIAALVQMGLGGLPLQLFAKGLALIFSTIQALVFATLSTIYLAMILPHEEAHASH